jgi:hypothetical protein
MFRNISFRIDLDVIWLFASLSGTFYVECFMLNDTPSSTITFDALLRWCLESCHIGFAYTLCFVIGLIGNRNSEHSFYALVGDVPSDQKMMVLLFLEIRHHNIPSFLHEQTRNILMELEVLQQRLQLVLLLTTSVEAIKITKTNTVSGIHPFPRGAPSP